MKKRAILCSFIFLFLQLAVRAQESIVGQPLRPPPPPPRVTVQDDAFQSAALARPMPFRVILPAGYEAAGRRYPVLYLLHGLTGAFSDWEGRTNLAEYARHYDLIVVMPDGNDSWYTNSAGEPQDKFEDYIVKDLLLEIDKKYRTINARYARAIAGLSMGGYGALKLAVKYPQSFAFGASVSGALQVARDADFMSSRPGKYRDGIVRIFGPAGSQTRADNDICALIKKAEPANMPYFYLDCGTEDGLLQPNREFVALLQQQKIAYEYRELPGAHTWAYWDQQIQQMLEVLARKMKIGPRP